MNQKIQRTIFIKLTFLIAFSWGLLFSGNTWANVPGIPGKSKTRIKLEYFKKGDNTKQIKATASSRVNRKRVRLQNVILTLFDETDSTKKIMTATTDKKGVAIFTLSDKYPIGKDGGPSVFSVVFDENDKFKPASKEIEVKDIELNANYKIIDSVYTVQVSAYELVNGQPGDPVSDLDVDIYVQRLFSLLIVGEGFLEVGKASIVIPYDIPGDYKNHDLRLVTMIPESDEYGTVETGKTMHWGAPLPKYPNYDDVNQRALWEPRAPLWMVITLAVLMIGVYSHYLYIAYKLYKIKKIGENEPA